MRSATHKELKVGVVVVEKNAPCLVGLALSGKRTFRKEGVGKEDSGKVNFGKEDFGK